MGMIANKLKRGDLIRVLAPSQSYGIVKSQQREIARKRVEEDLGWKITFGKHVEEIDEFNSSSIRSRLEDLHQAFADPEVAGILCIEGGGFRGEPGSADKGDEEYQGTGRFTDHCQCRFLACKP